MKQASMSGRSLQLLLLWVTFVEIVSYGQYRLKLPNGKQVSHPCKPNFLWQGVGHRNTRGGGARNPFGIDFANAGYKWTEQLCEKDSDGDGVSNGMELGDPDCKWTPDTIPTRTIDITHPGVCTPFTSEQCAGKNDWVDCKDAVFECPAVSNQDTENITLKFPRTPVPAHDTTYICMVFDVPADKDYHMIGYKPVIDNDNVMHHIVVYGCDETVGSASSTPYQCNMDAGKGCETIIGAWSLGEAGDCLNDKFGLLFGKNKYKKFALEFHWNNPKKVANWHDESGVVFYYTSKLRPNNGAVLSLGQLYLAIPPQSPGISFTSRCSSACTKKALNGSVFVTLALNHMHYLGTAQSVELLRDGERMQYVTNDNSYRYDDPKFFIYDTPLEIKPGDEVVTKCTFQNANSRNWVYYGEATSDEMCYAYLWFFPAEAMEPAYCLGFKSIEVCSKESQTIDGCNVNDFLEGKSIDSLQAYDDLTTHCVLSEAECTEHCRRAAKKARQHPCLRGGDVAEYVESVLKVHNDTNIFMDEFQRCAPMQTITTVKTTDNGAPTGDSTQLVVFLCVLVPLMAASLRHSGLSWH